MREIIETAKAPAPIGPYSQAIRANGFIFVSGQIPIDPGTGNIVGEEIAEATAKVIRPGGAFLVYQFSPKVRDFIAPHFEPIKRGFEWINVPPATLFWAYKGEPS